MLQNLKSRTLALFAGTALAVAAGAMFVGGATAQNKEPIKIGFGMAQTGPLAANGKQALLGMKIWEEEINAKGGLLGRPVKLVYYDDQSNPSTVPGIYTKLLDVDKVDLIIGGYGTNMLAPAMPLVMQRKKLFIGLLGLGVGAHRPELEHPERHAVLARPLLGEHRGAAAVDQDPERDHGQQRREEDEQHHSGDTVADALDEPAHQRASWMTVCRPVISDGGTGTARAS